ncbi:MAG: hypothetical protein ACK5Z2_15130 [Bacteroidota bacterium]
MQQFKFPYSNESALFVQSIFSMALINKEADSLEVLIDGLPFCLQPSDNPKQIQTAVGFFNPAFNSRLIIRFYLRHKIVRSYEFTCDPQGSIVGDEKPSEIQPEALTGLTEEQQVPTAEEIISAYGEPQSEDQPRTALDMAAQIQQAVHETGLLLGAALGAMDHLSAQAQAAAELADVRGQLLDTYEVRIKEQQEELDRFHTDFGSKAGKSLRIIRTFNGERCAGIIIEKAALQKQLIPLFELFKFFTGQGFGSPKSESQQPK